MESESHIFYDNLKQAFIDSGIFFQQECIALVKETVKTWKLEFEEYPVSFADQESRVDFIASKENSFLIAECKKCDSQYKSWLFSRSKTDNFGNINSFGIIKEAHYSNSPENERNKAQMFKVENKFYENFADFQSYYGLEVKKQSKEQKNFNLENIQKAAFQVTLSLFGFMKEKWDYLTRESCGRFAFYPVIFTTADLFYFEKNFNSKDEIFDFKKIPWVIYNSGISDKIWKHSNSMSRNNWGDFNKKIPILIVSFEEINNFFKKI